MPDDLHISTVASDSRPAASLVLFWASAERVAGGSGSPRCPPIFSYQPNRFRISRLGFCSGANIWPSLDEARWQSPPRNWPRWAAGDILTSAVLDGKDAEHEDDLTGLRANPCAILSTSKRSPPIGTSTS